MRKFLYPVLPFVFSAIVIACGPESTENTPLHPALLNPLVKPYTEAIATDSLNAELYHQRAAALHKIDMDELSLVDLRQALRLDANNDEYRISLVSLLIDMGKGDEALPEIKILQQHGPEVLDFKVMEAQALLSAGKATAAKILVEQLLQSEGQHPYLLLEASKIAAYLSDTVGALRYAEQLATSAPDFYDGVYHLADMYAATRNPKAIQWYEKVFALDTLNAYPIYDMAAFYLRQADTARAKQLFVKSISVDRDFLKTYIDYGHVLLAQDSVEKADRQFQIATEIAPASAEAYYGKGLVAQRQQKFKLASGFFKQALVFNGDYNEAREALEVVSKQLESKQ
ncbi:MAG TPA: tetratricopeptide repeat protein [Edaphocola sp.]|nr:tetratricopeptide repeat protein [Edaphocola sp.]